MANGSGRRRWQVILSLVLLPASLGGGRPAAAATRAPSGLYPGAIVHLDQISLIVPAPGHGVWGAALDVRGLWRSFGVQTAPDGTVTIVRPTRVALDPHHSDLPSDACSDKAYSLYSNTWNSTYGWHFNVSTTPSEVTQANATSGLRDAVENITHADNNCGLSDKVSAKQVYKGTTAKSPNIGSSSSCLGSDGTSVVAFGDLASTDLAFTCWWTSGGNTVEADLRLNKVEFSWVVNIGPSCVTKYSVEAVATHEFGHVYGLGHVSEALHGSLTMSPVILPCQSSEKSLGKGDVLGLEAQY